MRHALALVPTLACLCLSAPAAARAAQGRAAPSPEQLQALLKRVPDADADRNGTLTLAECDMLRHLLRKS
jgi:hypothetical protein